jgi:hypothetical protein
MHKAVVALDEAKVPNVEPLDFVEVPTPKTLLYNKTQY